jgi:hypothetical protein
MKRALVAAFLVLVAGCDREARVFGRSYDECVLKNASTGGDEASRDRSTEICARHFQRPPTQREAWRVYLKANQIHLDSPSAHPWEPSDKIEVKVINTIEDAVVTQVEVVFEFYRENPWKDATQVPVNTLTWTLDVATQPNSTETVLGTFEGNKPPAPFGKLISSKPTTILPLK